ncbi:MAG TPA: DNA repair protein RadA [Acidimicrobiia bacterium]|nr:DNA repair protein RadA [Acidimicrobiia bacterium]
MKVRSVHRCGECGAESPRWLGRCPACGVWGSLAEAVVPRARSAAPLAAPGAGPVPIGDVERNDVDRCPTGIAELDRVLGGGLVPGSVTLLVGEPGMGKSTLLLQALGRLAAAGSRCLLIGAEESPRQVRLRAERVGALEPSLLLAGDTELGDVVAHVEATGPDVLAIDSIQAISDPDRPGTPGSIAQVRDCAQALVRVAKTCGIPVILVGHVTKEGALAGPRSLEHLVDTVLTFDGDRHHTLRFLHALKHRFGPTTELGLFEMCGDGLVDVPDPSALFLSDRRLDAPGSVVAPIVQGRRPMLVEVQALVAPTSAPMPRRSATGLDASRLPLLLAILEQHAGIRLGTAEVYASVAGGVRAAEPGVDLAVALAIVSARDGTAMAPGTVAIGEIGLGGELRQVTQSARRVAEAARLGFTQVIGPPSLPSAPGLQIAAACTLREAIGRRFGATGARAA